MRTVAIVVCGIIIGACSTAPSDPQSPSTATSSKPGRESHVAFVMPNAEVVRIDDGDTVTVKAGAAGTRFTIRMSDIDTPEVFHKRGPDPANPGQTLPDRPGQRHGRAATASLLQIVPVGSRATAECYEVDQYGRFVCHVFAANINANLEQLKRGWAMTPDRADWIRDPQSVAAQAAAKAARLGVWRDPQPMSPADWRRVCWRDGKCDSAEK